MYLIDFDSLFSKPRMDTYYKMFPLNREKALEYYQLNIQVSESFYPLLCTIEIVLRNSIHNSFKYHFKNEFWFNHLKESILIEQVEIAKNKSIQKATSISADKIVSELNFGFWTCLFNKQFAKNYWKPLMHVFPNIHASDKKRDKISFKLNQVRKFRNRIFHYEPLCNDLINLEKNHKNIYELIEWIEPKTSLWLKEFDRFNPLFKQAKILKEFHI